MPDSQNISSASDGLLAHGNAAIAASAQPTCFAAVDLGSNSFHMLIVRYQQGRFIHLARAKEMVQLARGIDADGNLCPEARARARACLQDFQRILGQFPGTQVAAVATQVLRMANQPELFIKQAGNDLQTPVRIISGDEEARLVYQGVAHALADRAPHRLVIDIGGASTELIIGHQQQPILLRSLQLGCVTSGDKFFRATARSGANQRIDSAAFTDCYQHACAQISSASTALKQTGWQVAAGASGTLKIIAELLGDQLAQPIISRDQLQQLIDTMLQQGHLQTTLPDNLRFDVLPAGLAILQALFDVLEIDEILVAAASLKEGLLLDMIHNTVENY